MSSQGVVEFSLCLLFAKLVSYTFLYWLPLYISNVGQYSHTCREKKYQLVNTDTHAVFICFPLTAHFDAREAGDLSTLFDVGGIVGKYNISKYFLALVCLKLYVCSK